MLSKAESAVKPISPGLGASIPSSSSSILKFSLKKASEAAFSGKSKPGDFSTSSAPYLSSNLVPVSKATLRNVIGSRLANPLLVVFTLGGISLNVAPSAGLINPNSELCSVTPLCC